MGLLRLLIGRRIHDLLLSPIEDVVTPLKITVAMHDSTLIESFFSLDIFLRSIN